MARNYLSVDDLTPGELRALFDLSAKVKADPSAYGARLAGRSIALVFEKPSTRTRVSFEVGVAELGAHPLVISSSELQLGRGETIEDTGRVLSRYVQAIAAHLRAGASRAAGLHVLRARHQLALDFEHPCQALADLFTIRERLGGLQGRTLAYLGDGNNVAHSLLLGGAKTGMHVRIATPPGFEPIPQVVNRAAEIAAENGGTVQTLHDPGEAAEGADALYTDVWASMGREDEADERALVFPAYQLNQKLLDLADPRAIVMHCLPAHRGQEITDEVIDGPRSAVWDQAENRLHTQKALLLTLFEAI
ncbi:MAG: ornithine carbamoyltransferase [Actinomycetota bacterium]